MARALDANNSLTLKEMKEGLNNSVSVSKVNRILKKMDYSRKKLTLVPIERNEHRVLELKRIYCRYIQNINNSSMIFLDEFGINNHTTRGYRYSQRN